jgi:Uma2 family endonuclease
MYATAGIRDYWVVDVRNEAIEVRRDPGPNGYANTETYSGGQQLRPLCCPDAILTPAEIWE